MVLLFFDVINSLCEAFIINFEKFQNFSKVVGFRSLVSSCIYPSHPIHPSLG